MVSVYHNLKYLDMVQRITPSEQLDHVLADSLG